MLLNIRIYNGVKKRNRMIKFILAVIAMIFVALAAYMYMNPKAEAHAPVAKTTQETSMVKKETPSVQQENVSAKAEVASEKKSSVKNPTVKSPKVVSSETSNEMVDEEEVGKGLTLESIENANVSDEEKGRMRDDMAYYQGLHAEPSEPLSDEDIQKMIDEDLKNGLIQQ